VTIAERAKQTQPKTFYHDRPPRTSLQIDEQEQTRARAAGL